MKLYLLIVSLRNGVVIMFKQNLSRINGPVGPTTLLPLNRCNTLPLKEPVHQFLLFNYRIHHNGFLFKDLYPSLII